MTQSLHSTEELRQKYIRMAKNVGIDQTISALHNEIGMLERKIYDDGFKRERLDQVQTLRDLSRELWTKQFEMKK